MKINVDIIEAHGFATVSTENPDNIICIMRGIMYNACCMYCVGIQLWRNESTTAMMSSVYKLVECSHQ